MEPIETVAGTAQEAQRCDTQDLPAQRLVAVRDLVLQLADDDLVLGHRDSEWLGLAPDLEPDVAMASIAQDEVGHAAAFYGLLEELGLGAPDRLAFGRSPGEFRNAVLLELPNGPGTYLEAPRFDWAFAVVRHYVYDLFESIRLEALAASTFAPLARLARKIQVEERYHLLYGHTWLARLAAGPPQARRRLELALRRVLEEAADLCDLGQHEAELVAAGLVPASSTVLRERWCARLRAALQEAGLGEGADLLLPGRPAGHGEGEVRAGMGLNGRCGRHSPHLVALLDTMGEVIRSDREAIW